ncbi:helix-turn-helix domain-containing protein [Microbacterium sp. zg.Y909]|uniref:helix-turn-helix domain-containing protein n=1 Tax=Microbacterium sp. zg.Y909 TaxID=2969413 RepID=UPI00214B34BF|nr:helix-turn-helix domain-containing protein [Microbacterium sp. zg.Y909]MCR2826159.1 helix-turn-helix domain-containing protein [Microbacterium sp. zg.Y909]
MRLELLRRILTGTTTTAQLADIDTLGTMGQLHHHLRQLVSAGWVRQSGRGSYEVPAARVVPLLTGLFGSGR